jgi:hypothetical protein
LILKDKRIAQHLKRSAKELKAFGFERMSSERFESGSIDMQAIELYKKGEKRERERENHFGLGFSKKRGSGTNLPLQTSEVTRLKVSNYYQFCEIC